MECILLSLDAKNHSFDILFVCPFHRAVCLLSVRHSQLEQGALASKVLSNPSVGQIVWQTLADTQQGLKQVIVEMR